MKVNAILVTRSNHSKKVYFLTKHMRNLIMFEMSRRKHLFISKVGFYPYIATFSVTDNCNSRCVTCSQWRKKSYNELTTDELKDVFDQLSLTTVRNIAFTGGEPMLRQDIFKLVRYASSLGFRVSMVTNGLLINYEKAQKLVKNGLAGVCISIDGPEIVHDRIRGITGGYKKTLFALKIFADLKKKDEHINVNIATTIMKPTLDSIFHVVNLAEKFNVTILFNLLDFNPYFFKGIMWQDLWIKEQEKLIEVMNKIIEIKRQKPYLIANSIQSLGYAKQYFRDPLRRDIPCYLGFIELFIGSHGEVYPCWALKPVGNLRDKKLRDIINSEIYKHKLYDMWIKRCPGCSCGYIRNLDFHIPSFSRELCALPQFTLKRILAL